MNENSISTCFEISDESQWIGLINEKKELDSEGD